MGKKHHSANTLRFEALESRQLLSVTVDTLAAANAQDDVAAVFSSANLGEDCSVDLKGWTAGDVEVGESEAASAISAEAQFNKVSVSWDAMDGASKYTMQYQIAGSKTWVTRTVTGTECTFYGVLGKDYNVRVKAKGASDDTYVSLEAPVRLLDLPVLTRNALGSDFVKLSIANENLALGNENDILTVSVKDRDTGEVTQIAVAQGEAAEAGNGITAAFDGNDVLIAGLTSRTRYQVWAVNSNVASDSVVSESLKSNILSFRTCYENPTVESVESVSDRSLKVTWSDSDAEAQPKFYTVQYTKNGRTWLTATTVARGNEFTIKGLKPGTEYGVRVYATGGKPNSALALSLSNGNLLGATKDSYKIYSMSVKAFSGPEDMGYAPNSAILAEITGKDANGNTYDMELIQSIKVSCRLTGSVTLQNGKTGTITSNVVSVINHELAPVYYGSTQIGTLTLHGSVIRFMPTENVAYATLGFTLGSPMTFSSNTATYYWKGSSFTTNKVYVEYVAPEEVGE